MAAQAAAAEAAVVCSDETKLPATVNCGSDLIDKMTAAANTVSIGGSITVTNPISEGYFCHDDTTDKLVEVGTLDARPDDCTAQGSSDIPGDYVYVTVNYTFTPLFPGLSAVSLADTAMTSEGWMRVG
ncbi:hypothetical protein MTR64_09085 [Novosphingobium sp. 2580]|uniref:Uncharacterized protein n=2 Tax=Novosphingobium album (ex Hu et al. 2023) TaxID=2930093 RepID=A0ABT0B0X1_9SPHN|nr:hypothetical protein [Novosphingobium album (ex Hu et al. 2023)]